MRRIIFLTAVLAAIAGLLTATASARGTVTISTVATGLDHPNGLAFGADGTLYIAEMGHGGDTCYAEPNFVGLGDLGPACYGRTGAVTRIKAGHRGRVVVGLFSVGVFGGLLALGPNGVAVDDRGHLLVTTATPGPCRAPGFFSGWAEAQMGKLLAPAGSRIGVVADLSGYACGHDAEGSLPIGLASRHGAIGITDAGSGDIYTFRGNALTRLVRLGAEFSPTSITPGPDGSWYVGVCNCSGQGSVIRVLADGHTTTFADGFGWITAVAAARGGVLYVVDEQFDDQGIGHGEVVKLGPGGARTTVVPFGLLEFPSQAAVGPDGALYVTNHTQSSPTGEVLRITS
jgi:hypothetical protein